MNGPFIRIDDLCATSMRDVWAIGDVTGEPMLAHRAMAQGEMVAAILSGHRRAWDKVTIPAVTFTDPEVVSVGLSPAAARAACGDIRSGVFPFRANGRAMTRQAEAGFVRIIARADNHVVLGMQAVGGGVLRSYPRALLWRSKWGLDWRISWEPSTPTRRLARRLVRVRSRRWALRCIFDGRRPLAEIAVVREAQSTIVCIKPKLTKSRPLPSRHLARNWPPSQRKSLKRAAYCCCSKAEVSRARMSLHRESHTRLS